MLQALIIVLLSLVIGHTTAIFASNQCVSNAFYNETSVLCQCKPGYNGLGDMCCDLADDYYNCNVGGDPWITSYDGTRTPLNFPCLGRVAVVKGKTSAGNDCQVEVISTARIVKSGAIYPDRLVVAFSIKGQEAQYFKIVGSTIHRPGDPEPITYFQLYREKKFRMALQGELIAIRYHSKRKTWRIIGCSSMIAFRSAADDKAIQEYRPGICVSVLKSSSMAPMGDVSNGDVCSMSSQPTPADLMSGFVKDLNSLGPLSSVQADYQESCENIKGEAQACGDSRDSAVSSCVALLYNPVVRLCLTVSGVPGPDIVNMFSYCLEAFCNLNQAQCAARVASLPPLGSCFPSFCNRPVQV